MKKLPPLDEAEMALFRQAVADVRPLKASGRAQANRSKTPIRVRAPETNIEMVSQIEDAEPLGSDAVLSFCRTGIQNKVFRKLRQGAIRPEAELDLHGMYAEKAKQAVNQFLVRCLARQYYCVAIIHGKGSGRSETPPILKNKLNNWLRNYEDVLAFHSAPLRRGGVGAVWILLRKKLNSD